MEQKNFKYPFYSIFHQINIYYHYYCSRVFMLSAETGQGKSTQFPKLLNYCYYVLYNVFPKILITQPRILPVENNFKTITNELNTNYFYEENDPFNTKPIQYKTSKKNEVDINNNKCIMIYTDGLFLLDLFNNFILKKFKNNQFTISNIFDIIIIDEAHEHNKNIDFALTILRISLCFNLTLKIIIVSAT